MLAGLAPDGTSGTFSWLPDATPSVRSIDPTLVAMPFVTGWNRALVRPAEVEVNTVRLADTRPRAISIAVAKSHVEVKSFAFAEVDAPTGPWNNFTLPVTGGLSRPTVASTGLVTSGRRTPIQPPADVVKLEDRLRYLLQPSLEAILVERSLEFPFQPFPYQLEGVAFLYARHAAILADEMGLGKTM
jgi:hypothetical protein